MKLDPSWRPPCRLAALHTTASCALLLTSIPAQAVALRTEATETVVPAIWLLLVTLTAAFGIAAVWWITRRNSLHWVERLHAKAGLVALGQVPDSSEFTDAPPQVQALATQLRDMGASIHQRDETLRQAVQQQKALALELHHRVRNNLQIIASFLSLHTEALPDGADRKIADRTRLRVAALALVHRLLFEDGELTTISTARLLDPLCRLLSQHPGIADKFEVDCEVADVAVTIDTAVPLTLWIVEAIETLVVRGAGTSDASLLIALSVADSTLWVTVSGTGLGPPIMADPVGERLTVGIARQLGATLTREQSAPDSETLAMQIPGLAQGR